MNPTKARYALLVAADALQDDPSRLEAEIADDGTGAEMDARQVIDALRFYAAVVAPPVRLPAPLPSPPEQREIDRFGIWAEEAREKCDCGHVAAVHGPGGCVAASGCDCRRGATS